MLSFRKNLLSLKFLDFVVKFEYFFASLFSFQGAYRNPKGILLVGLGGLEPPTSRLSGVRSNHLSYKPINS